jgi:hypothetical protein
LHKLTEGIDDDYDLAASFVSEQKSIEAINQE